MDPVFRTRGLRGDLRSRMGLGHRLHGSQRTDQPMGKALAVSRPRSSPPSTGGAWGLDRGIMPVPSRMEPNLRHYRRVTSGSATCHRLARACRRRSRERYVNGCGFDLAAERFAPEVIALAARDGSIRQVADGLAFPNGMLVTADNRTRNCHEQDCYLDVER